MAARSYDAIKTLEKMGYIIYTGTEAASRHDEIVELDSLIKSPMTEVPDKVNFMDSLINRNIQWGYGRTDQFWDMVFNTWRKGFHLVWTPIMSTSMPPRTLYHIVSYKEKVIGLDGKPATETRTAQIMTGTLRYLYARRDRYTDVEIIEDKEVRRPRSEFYNPNVDFDKRYEQAMDFGREVVLKWGWQALNYNMAAEHINPAHVLVIQGLPQIPTTETKKAETHGVPTA